MHDGHRLIARIEPIFLRHRRALQATTPTGAHLTYGPHDDLDFIACAVWTMWEMSTVAPKMAPHPPKRHTAV